MKNKDFNWLNGCDSGVLRPVNVYVGMNNFPPNKFINKLDKVQFDMEHINLDELKQKFPNAYFSYTAIHDECTKSSVEDEEYEEEDDEVYAGGMWQSSTLNIFNEEVIYIIDADSVSIYYNDQDAKSLYKELYDLLPKKVVKPQEAEIKLVVFNNEYYTVSSKIKKAALNIEENYNDDFKPVFEDIKNFLTERGSGLIILRGEKGTGKTSLIRGLISAVPRHYILITNAMAEHLASPEFMSFMLDHKDSVYILEDCEQILMRRTDGFGENGAIANILNMSDGLMSDIFNVKFICTFNADIDKIDDALLRKGRCFANYEFKPLCKEKTKALLNKLNIKADEIKEMTLADIYNYGDNDCTGVKVTKKIGF